MVEFTNIVSTPLAGCAELRPHYRIEYTLYQTTTAGTLQLRYGNPIETYDNTTNRYADNYSGEGGGPASRPAAAVSACRLEYSTQRVGTDQHGTFDFSHNTKSDKYVQGINHTYNEYSGDSDDGVLVVGDTACYYPRSVTGLPSRGMDRLYIFTNAGTFTGDVTLAIFCSK